VIRGGEGDREFVWLVWIEGPLMATFVVSHKDKRHQAPRDVVARNTDPIEVDLPEPN
jgi:hypothetical protein